MIIFEVFQKTIIISDLVRTCVMVNNHTMRDTLKTFQKATYETLELTAVRNTSLAGHSEAL